MHNMISKEVLDLKKDKIMALKDSLFRVSAPNLSNLFATIFMALLVIYFQGFMVNVPVGNIHQRWIVTRCIFDKILKVYF